MRPVSECFIVTGHVLLTSGKRKGLRMNGDNHDYFINGVHPPKTFLWSMFWPFFRVKREILNVNGFLKMIF